MREVRQCVHTGAGEGEYRYLLEIDLGRCGPPLVVIGKNPSTAAQQRSDPTLGKIEAWATRHGYGSVVLVNLFGIRHTRPEHLVNVSYEAAVGPENDLWIAKAMECRGAVVVAAWGDPGPVERATYDRRVGEVLAIVGQRLNIVGPRTRKGYPRHGRLWNKHPELTSWSPTGGGHAHL